MGATGVRFATIITGHMRAIPFTVVSGQAIIGDGTGGAGYFRVTRAAATTAIGVPITFIHRIIEGAVLHGLGGTRGTCSMGTTGIGFATIIACHHGTIPLTIKGTRTVIGSGTGGTSSQGITGAAATSPTSATIGIIAGKICGIPITVYTKSGARRRRGCCRTSIW